MAFELSYAGIPLPLITDDVERELDLTSVAESMDSLRNGWPSSELAQRSWGAQPRQRKPKLGTLFEPCGAGRHSVGCFLATRSIVNQIRDAGFVVGSGGGSGSGSGGASYDTLVMQTAQGRVERTMRCLPPKPIAGLNDPQLFVLTLVDRRYDAMNDPAPTNGPYVEWTSWLNDLDSIRTVFSGNDTLDARIRGRGYLRPARPMWEGYRWPAVVEAACVTLGVRFNGEHFVDREWSANRIAANLDDFQRFSGGRYSWADTTGVIDNSDRWLRNYLPSRVIVDWPFRGNLAKWYRSEAATSGFGHPWRLTATGIVCPCTTSSGSGSGAIGSGSASPGECIESETSIQAFTDQLAASLVAWAKLGFCDLKTPGINEWVPDGVHDVEYVYRGDGSYTRIYRAPWNDAVELVQISACAETGGSGNKIRVPLVTGVCARFNPSAPGSGGGDGQCPPGQHYDQALRMCVDD